MTSRYGWLFAFVFVFLSAGVAHAQSPKGEASQMAEAPSHNFGLRIEPGVAVPLSSPQSNRFDVGGGQTVKGFYNLAPWLDIGPTISFTDLPAADGFQRSGTSWDFGAGVRVKGPVTGDGLFGMIPWADADVLYSRTGDLDRPGFDVGAGLMAPVGKNRSFRLGPFVRYRHIVQGEKSGFDNRDAKLLHAGVSLEFGAPTRGAASASQPAAAEKDCPPCEQQTEPAEELSDADEDGFPDKYDRCPDAAGPEQNYGCPEYEDAEVEEDKIELEDRVYFAWDSADIKEQSHGILDQAAKVLKENEGFTVRVEGHADATGLASYNQQLSERRAQAVVDYLVEQGVDRDRFVVKGYSSSQPADSNLTDAGRQKNRRVEFNIDLEILEEDRSEQ
jgi:outer membrane protein OmpA-like peptidoglycan-associated protein